MRKSIEFILSSNIFLLPEEVDETVRKIYEITSKSKDSKVIGEIESLAKKLKDPNFFQKFFTLMTGLKFNPNTARDIWYELQKHYRHMCQKIGRDIHISTAIADYFLQVKRSLQNPAVIDLIILEESKNRTLQDLLTGFLKGYLFEKFVSKEINRSIRHKHFFSIVMLKLNGLNYSSLTSEMPIVLKIILDVAKTIEKLKRSEDIAFRFSIDKFGLILPHTDKKGSIIFANRLLSSINNEIINTELLFGLTLNAGAQTFPEDGEDAKTLISKVEKCLYKSRIEGPNRIVYSL